jgi:hypothetical protein
VSRMVGCSAPNCSNSSRQGFRLFIFPLDPDRRSRWLINCRRDKWSPTAHSRLCEVHFEESQFEPNRTDGWRKLKPNAIPTIFAVPNPPHLFQSKRRVLKRGSEEDDVISRKTRLINAEHNYCADEGWFINIVLKLKMLVLCYSYQ